MEEPQSVVIFFSRNLPSARYIFKNSVLGMRFDLRTLLHLALSQGVVVQIRFIAAMQFVTAQTWTVTF